jgi:hypothetical protein
MKVIPLSYTTVVMNSATTRNISVVLLNFKIISPPAKQRSRLQNCVAPRARFLAYPLGIRTGIRRSNQSPRNTARLSGRVYDHPISCQDFLNREECAVWSKVSVAPRNARSILELNPFRCHPWQKRNYPARDKMLRFRRFEGSDKITDTNLADRFL